MTAKTGGLFNWTKNRGREFYTKVFHISTSGPKRKPEAQNGKSGNHGQTTKKSPIF